MSTAVSAKLAKQDAQIRSETLSRHVMNDNVERVLQVPRAMHS